MYVCLCKGITDTAIRKLGRSGIVEADELIDVLGLESAECCGRCVKNIVEIAALVQTERIDLPLFKTPAISSASD